MLPDSETWLVKNQAQFALWQAGMRMTRWMCGAKVRDWFTCNDSGDRLAIDDVITALQRNILRWYERV